MSVETNIRTTYNLITKLMEGLAMKVRSVIPMRIAKVGYIVISVAMLASGILFLTQPDISMKIIGRMLGISMMLFGGIKLVGYFSKDLFRLAFQYDLQFGILALVLGLIILLKPYDVINLLFVAMGIVLFAESLFKIQIAIESKKFGIKKWWGILLLAVITGVTALILVFKPSESTRMLIILLGVTLITEGFLNMVVTITTVKIVKHQYPDYIEDN